VAVKTELTYTLAVTNHGPAAAADVVLTDLLPAGAVFVSATSSAGSCARGGKGRRDGVVTCELGTLASGGVASVTVVVEPVKAGTLINTATVVSGSPDPNRADNSATEETSVF
jgi:uncharacterized repeat protein (TIGR01451 family)